MGVVITEEQAPATIPAVAWTVTISAWDGFFLVSSVYPKLLEIKKADDIRN